MKTQAIDIIAKQFNCTPEQVRKQFALNAAQLSAMAAKARQTGRKVNGFTAQELEAMAKRAEASALPNF